MCIYIYICIYIYTHILIHTYIHTCIHMYISAIYHPLCPLFIHRPRGLPYRVATDGEAARTASRTAARPLRSEHCLRRALFGHHPL